MSSYYRLQLEEWLKTIYVDRSIVLDVGGSQYPVKNRTAVWNPSKVDILDLHCPHETKREPNVICDLNLSNDIGEPKYQADENLFHKYDTAFCLEVTEYLWDPVQALKNIRYFLKDGGDLYISFPFLYPLHPPTGMDYMRYTKYGVVKLLYETGFTIVNQTPRVAHNKNILFDFFTADRYRSDRNDTESLFDTGSLIHAKAI